MQRLEYDRYGGPEVMQLRSYTLLAPKDSDVVVRVAAAAINPMDWKVRNGDVKFITGKRFPRGMGSDFSGTVEAVGSQVSKFKPGDAVLGTVAMKDCGAFAPKVITQQNLLVKKPPEISFESAATLPTAGVTAWQAVMQHGHLIRGQKLFVNGALGCVGQAAVAIGLACGAEVFGTVGPKSLAAAEALGIRAFDYTQPLPPSLEHSFDVVFDCAGTLSMRAAGRLRKSGGSVVHIVLSGPKIVGSMLLRQKALFADVRVDTIQSVVDLAVSGKLTLPIVRTVKLEEAPTLLSQLEQGIRLNGKAVILLDEQHG